MTRISRRAKARATPTEIATTSAALSGATDIILGRIALNEGHISKNGVLDCLAKAIGGPRQNWGGILRHQVFTGTGTGARRVRLYGGDVERAMRFLETPHAMLGGKAPLALATSSSAGADAVIDLLQRAEASFAA